MEEVSEIACIERVALSKQPQSQFQELLDEEAKQVEEATFKHWKVKKVAIPYSIMASSLIAKKSVSFHQKLAFCKTIQDRIQASKQRKGSETAKAA